MLLSLSQPTKAISPMLLMVLGIVSAVRFAQPLNAAGAISTKLERIETLCFASGHLTSLVWLLLHSIPSKMLKFGLASSTVKAASRGHSSKAWSSIVVTEAGMFICVRALQPLKTALFIVVVPLGIVTLLRLSQPRKRPDSRTFMFLGSVTLSRLLQPRKTKP